jgi:hypothetical protein
MELESVFTDSKWQILTELSHNALSPSELAKKTGTSLPNISTQLRLLEALDFIEEEKLNNVAKGEPRKLYSLKKDFAYLILGSKTVIGKKMFKLDTELKFFFSVWMINDLNAPHLLIKLYIENEHIFKESLALGYLAIKGDELEILVITPNPEAFHNHKGAQITWHEKTYNVKAHIHTKEEFENGVANNDEYFNSLLKKIFILIDKDNVLSKLKKGGR